MKASIYTKVRSTTTGKLLLFSSVSYLQLSSAYSSFQGKVQLKSLFKMYGIASGCKCFFAIYRCYIYSVRLSTMHEDHFTTCSHSHSHSHSNFS